MKAFEGRETIYLNQLYDSVCVLFSISADGEFSQKILMDISPISLGKMKSESSLLYALPSSHKQYPVPILGFFSIRRYSVLNHAVQWSLLDELAVFDRNEALKMMPCSDKILSFNFSLAIKNQGDTREISEVLTSRFKSCQGDTLKARMNRSEKALFAVKLLSYLNPLDLGVDQSIKTLGLTRNELALHSLIHTGQRLEREPWSRYKTRQTLQEFTQQGWCKLEHEDRRSNDGSGVRLGLRVRLTPKFFIECLGIVSFPDAFIGLKELKEMTSPDEKWFSEIEDAYFSDQEYLIVFNQKLTKERAFLRKEMKKYAEGEVVYKFLCCVVEHLDSLLGERVGGRPKVSISSAKA